MQLILASSSLGRKQLLSYLKIPFIVMPSTLNEEKIIGKNPLDTLRLRAKLKGEEVFRMLQCNNVPMLQRKYPKSNDQLARQIGRAHV